MALKCSFLVAALAATATVVHAQTGGCEVATNVIGMSLDVSGSLSGGFQTEKDAAVAFIETTSGYSDTTPANGNRYYINTFDSSVRSRILLNTNENNQQAVAVANLPFSGGNTNIRAALEDQLAVLASEAPALVVLITDGVSLDFTAAAQNLKDAGITLACVAVAGGSGTTNTNILNQRCSKKADGVTPLVFTSSQVADIGALLTQVVENIGPGACGDGTKDDDEECDDGESNSDATPDACREDCTLPTCGDGVTDTGEDCDAGASNSDDTADACRANCEAARCGDGVTDTGEECDAGAGNSDDTADACRTNCKAARCGDGVADSGEECDAGTGNSDDTADACRTNCKTARCGDGVTDTGEECDDGNNNDADACKNDCTLPRCSTETPCDMACYKCGQSLGCVVLNGFVAIVDEDLNAIANELVGQCASAQNKLTVNKQQCGSSKRNNVGGVSVVTGDCAPDPVIGANICPCSDKGLSNWAPYSVVLSDSGDVVITANGDKCDSTCSGCSFCNDGGTCSVDDSICQYAE